MTGFYFKETGYEVENGQSNSIHITTQLYLKSSKMVDQSDIGASSAVLDVVAQCPSYAAALGYIGVAAAVCLSNWGAAVRLKK